jgi:large subunit ribosomal protein L22
VVETIARLRHVRTSPTKVRPVLKLIAGQDVSEARDTLRLCERGIARELGKLLDSAIANAEHNDHVPEDELVVARAFADEGPTLKRWRPRARGRGVRIRKRSSHITIVVARLDDDALQERRRRETASGVSRGRPTRRRSAKPAEGTEPDASVEVVEAEGQASEDAASAEKPAKSAKKPAKSAKKPAKKAETTAKKASAEKGTAKKAPAKKRAPKKDD